MKRILFFFCAFFVVVNVSPSSGDEISPVGDRPNILFIFTDDQSHRTVSAYDEAWSWVDTPNIDRLAATGTLFKSAYMGSWCMPARASILTGKLPHAIDSLRMVGPYPGSEYDPQTAPFWPKVLRENGYVTAHIGKWHLGKDTGAGRDWDYQASWTRPDPNNPNGSRAYYFDQEISFNGEQAVTVGGYATDNYTNWAIDFIRGEHRLEGNPWFLWLCYTAPHHPYIPAERHRDLYAGAKVEVPEDIYPPRPGKPEYMQRISKYVPGSDGEPRYLEEGGQTLGDGVRQYHRVIASIDESVGRLVETLDASGQLENTMVVFLSDQGFAWGQHGFQTKVAPYDANLRAPFIISQPGTLPESQSIAAPVSGLDLVPTFFRRAGIPEPWKFHGKDLGPLLADPSIGEGRSVLLTFNGWTYGSDTNPLPDSGMDGHARRMGIPWYVMLRKGEYKYICTLRAGETEELYDLSSDPMELENLAGDERYGRIMDDFRRLAVGELARADAPFVDAYADGYVHGIK